MRKLIVLIVLNGLLVASAIAQTLQDDFTDGDFTNNPTWTGDVSKYIVNGSNQLRSDDLGNSSTAELSTAAAIQDSTFWEFYVEMGFNPSSSNRARIYLQADNASPSATTNGYYIEIGMTGSVDSLELYRVDGGTPTKILGGTAGAVATSPTVSVRVIRSSTGVWSLFADYSGGTTYTLEGTVTDATYTTGTHFGFWADYTTTRGDKFFFDNVYASPLVVDVTPPVVDSAAAISGTAVDVYFDEPVDAATANTASNYTIDNGISVSSAIIDGTDPTLVHLTTTAMISGTTYQLTVNGVEDLNSNAISNGQINYTYYNIQAAAFQDVIINEIFADPTPQVGLPNAEYVELYNRSSKYIQLSGMILNDGSDHTLPAYVLAPDSIVIITDDNDVGLFASFGSTVGINSISLSNSGELLTFKDNSGTTVDSVDYNDTWYQDANKDDGGWSLELINPNLLCQGASNWIASTNVSGGTPGQENSVFDNTPDAQAPSLVSASFIDSNTIILIFDEALGSNANNSGNYTLTGGLVVASATFNSPDTVILDLTSNMTDNTSYTVTVTNVTDCSGNAIAANNTANFTYFGVQAAAFQDIIINEIFADPSPQVGLPTEEFVELYNRSSKTIDLANYILNDGSDKTLPSQLMNPGDYVIIADAANASLFSTYGTVIGVSSLGLSNGGELLVLKNPSGITIDSVNYSDAWYQDGTKDDGGWTLELINPMLLCVGGNNWIASTDANGGTPGQQNSVYDNTPDTQAPSLVSANFVDSNTIILIFDETLGANAGTAGNYAVSGTTVSGATLVQPDTVILDLSANMTDNTSYTVTVSNVTDCSGNTIGSSNTANFTYYEVSLAAFQEVIISEIHADPAPVVGLPDAEYVELYNRSNKTINLADYTLNDGTDRTLPAALMPAGSYAVVVAASNASSFMGIGTVVPISNLSLSNSGEKLVLRNSNGTLLNEVDYSNDWYGDPNKDDGGYSLELINPNLLCKESSNWTASMALWGGTPAAQNTVYDNTPDNTPPNVVEAHQFAPNQIYIEYDDVMDAAQIADLFNYAVDNGINIVGVTYLSNDEVVLNLASNMVDQTTYTVTFSGIGDCVGNALAVSTASFTYYESDSATHYDIIINEIMADPNPPVGLPEKEYVELHNRSNKTFNLQGFTFNDGSTIAATLPFHILQPGGHVLVYSNSDTIGFGFFGDVLEVTSFPDLNTADDLVLYNPTGDVVDAVSYELSWYQNSDKDDGGWSLERINPNRPCEGMTNWRASENTIGGTPCTVNSVLDTVADTQSPDALRAFPLGADSIRVYFSEALDDAAAVDINNYSVDNGINVIRVRLEQPFYNSVVLILDNPIVAGITYNVTMSANLTDCLGNSIALKNTARFALPSDVEVGDLILNEILFNPVTGGKDFIELYNKSDKVLNSADLVISNARVLDGNLANASSLQTSPVEVDWLVFPNEYVVITEDVDQVKAQYYTENPNNFVENDLPTFGDNEGQVYLYATYDSAYVDTFGNPRTAYLVSFLDTFVYEDDFHSSLIDDENGVSLERIDFDAATNDQNNWHSAASDVGYATPAYQNSSFLINDIVGEDIIELPNETLSPDGDGYEDFLLINYNTDGLGYVANIDIYDATGRLIRNLVNGELLMTEGSLQWDGTDNQGRKARVGIHILTIEIFNPNGDVRRFKKTCIVAGKMSN